jgi:hypothetical protein
MEAHGQSRFADREMQLTPLRIGGYGLAPEILASCRRALLWQRIFDEVDIEVEAIFL